VLRVPVKTKSNQLRLARSQKVLQKNQKGLKQLPRRIPVLTRNLNHPQQEKPVKAAKEKPAKPAGEKAAPKKQAKKKDSAATKNDKQPSIFEALSKPKTSKSTAARPADSTDDDIVPSKKTAKPRKRKNSDSDSDSGPKQKSKTAKKPKGMDDSFHIDLTGSDSDVGSAPVRSRTARAKKAVTYLEDSDDEM
ncbi:hypothetical protein AB205_0073740, partial [Aquarana catesbeiana]